MDNEELSVYLLQEWAVEALPRPSMDELLEKLTARINDLIDRNIDRLLSLLYTIDISEKKLKTLLQANAGEDAGRIIARLIIERQLQKIKTRKEFKPGEASGPDEERW
jgi:hypothetical protein